MSKINSNRHGCTDVFRAFLVKNATYDGKLEIPVIYPEDKQPNRLIPFSKSLSTIDFNQWIHFYEDDVNFERIWNNPRKYLPLIKRFNGIITPDFSLYRDMPLVMQQWNTYRGKALGHWFQENGIKVIPNVRFGDERTYDFCCLGIQQGTTIAIGSYGCLGNKIDRSYFKKGLRTIIELLKPKAIIVYGSAPADIFSDCISNHIQIIQFESQFAQSRLTRHK